MPFNGFVNAFTNSPIQPANVTYLPLVFDGADTTIQLEWAFQNPATLYPFAQFIQCTGTGEDTYGITLPNALYASTVQSAIIYNQAAVDITLFDFTGSVIGVCEPSIAYFVGNTDNTTSAGSWVFLTLAAGTSSVTAADLVDSTLNPGVPASSEDEPNAGGLKAYSQYLKINQSIFPYTGTTYTGNQSDLGNVVTWEGGSGTYTLAEANSVSNGFIAGLQNRSTSGGIITITPQGGNFLNGSTSSIQMQVNESTYLVSDGGSNWYTFCYSSNIAYVIEDIQYDMATSGGTINVTNADGSFQIQTFSGTYGSFPYPEVIVNLPSNLTQQYFLNNISTTNNIVVKVSGDSAPYEYTIFPGDRLTAFASPGLGGTVHLFNSPNFIADNLIYLPDGSETEPSLTFVDDITTGIYRDSGTDALVITQDSVNTAEFTNAGITFNAPVEAPEYIQDSISIYSVMRAYE